MTTLCLNTKLSWSAAVELDRVVSTVLIPFKLGLSHIRKHTLEGGSHIPTFPILQFITKNCNFPSFKYDGHCYQNKTNDFQNLWRYFQTLRCPQKYSQYVQLQYHNLPNQIFKNNSKSIWIRFNIACITVSR